MTIYSRNRRIRGRSYSEHSVHWREPDGNPRKRAFGSLDEAKEFAGTVARGLSHGEAEAKRATPEDLAAYGAAVDLLRPLGVSLLQAASEYASARNKLPPNVSLTDTVVAYLRLAPTGMDRKRVRDVLKEYVADLERRGKSDIYVGHVGKYLSKFATAFECPLASVTTADFSKWLWSLKAKDGTTLALRSLFNHQRAVSGLMNFAARRKYIPRELSVEFAELETPEPEAPTRAVFTPKAFKTLLHGADSKGLAAFVLGGLCGLRTAEIGRLQWEQVKLDQGVVVVDENVAKTQSRRVVPLGDSALAWLRTCRNRKGWVCPVPEKVTVRVAAEVGVPWVKNGLRHGYASYRLATVQDAAKVAFECGNSPQMIQAHYRSLVTEAEAREWFSIMPPDDRRKPASAKPDPEIEPEVLN